MCSEKVVKKSNLIGLQDFLDRNKLTLQFNCFKEGIDSTMTVHIVGTSEYMSLSLCEGFGGWAESCQILIDMLSYKISGTYVGGRSVPELAVREEYQEYLDETEAWLKTLRKETV